MIERVLFAMAKEFGWTPEYILSMPYKFFKMYSLELHSYYKEMEKSSQGKSNTSPPTPLSSKEKEHKLGLLEKMKNG